MPLFRLDKSGVAWPAATDSSSSCAFSETFAGAPPERIDSALSLIRR